MAFFDIFKSKDKQVEAKADYSYPLSMDVSDRMDGVEASVVSYGPVYSVHFDGQRFDGELGTIKDYDMDHEALMLRGWQQFVESDVAQMVMEKYLTWVIGEGMKMQSVPMDKLVSAVLPDFDRETFSREFEARFSLWKDSNRSTKSGESTLNELSRQAYKSAKVGGDILVILNTTSSGELKVDTVDSSRLTNPIDPKLGAGQKIKNGVVYNKSGTHVGYWVNQSEAEPKFVKAKDSSGRRRAYLVYGKKYKSSDVRGLALFSSVMSTLSSMTRYKDSAVEGAEQRANIPFFMEHKEFATGENLYAGQMKNNLKTNKVAGGALDPDPETVKSAARIASAERNSVHNLPKGTSIKALESKMEQDFASFFRANLEVVVSALNMPVEVALSAYGSNYAASQGARTDWNRVCAVERHDFVSQFYGPIIPLFVELQAIQGRLGGSSVLNLSKTDKESF